MNVEAFSSLLRQRGDELYRAMPWRTDTRPYYVLVSELMLQQTQVSRVIPKFQEFITIFPNEQALAAASLADVIKTWQGLGYNRRAKFLHASAKQIVHMGMFPNTSDELIKLPGVGKNTAGAILAYSFNKPSIFVETNVRTVYIHHFFEDRFDIADVEIIKLIKKTLTHDNPRRFYQSLMDYGSWLKAQGVRNISSSKHYKKQSTLKGSVREVRGQIIRTLAEGDASLYHVMMNVSADERFESALVALIAEGLVMQADDRLYLTK